MEIKAVIFDLDGTLLHTIEDIAEAANVLLERNGRSPHTIADYLGWIGNGARVFIDLALGGKTPEDELEAIVKEFLAIYGARLTDKTRFYDGIAEMLDELTDRGLKLAVLSNKPHELTCRLCAHYLSRWPFEPILGQREGIPRKPDPQAALEIAEIWGIDPGKILFVGDSDNDVLTALGAGMHPLGVSWGYGRLKTKAVEGMGQLIDHPAALPHRLC
ncbi:MAG: HAD family hydrolase [Bacteroidetes bacterium]|nr:MAG: HAD family hydrolase [Bacteroidota bacterium]